MTTTGSSGTDPTSAAPAGPASTADEPASAAALETGPVAAVATRTLEALAGELAAGRSTSREAVRALIDHLVETAQLDAAERAELRELLADLVTNDPYLGGRVSRL